MVTHPLAAFVAGVQGGIEFRNTLKDRKLDRERQQKLDAITFAREARDQGEYDWQMGERRRARGLEDAAMADAKAAVDATQASLDAEAAGSGAATVSTAGGAVVPAVPNLVLPMGLPGAPVDPAAERGNQIMLDSNLGGSGGAPAPTVARTDVAAGPTQAAAARIARPAQFEPGPKVRPEVSPQTWAYGMRRGLGLEPVPSDPALLERVIDRSQYISPPPGSGGPAPQPQPAANAAQPADNPSRLSDPKQLMRLAIISDPTMPMEMRSQAAAQEGVPVPADDSAKPLTASGIAKGLPRPQPGPTRTAAAAMDGAQAGTAAVQTAAPPAAQDAAQAGAAAATGGKGFTPGQPISDGQRKRGTTAFMERYMEVGAPMVVESMLKRGDLKGAMEFMKFIDTAQTRKAMQTWANAAFAASVGDMDGFVDGVVDLYNDAEYFPDGTSIIKDRSKVVKDRETGAPVGALITFRDDKSGNTWEQIITDDDLMALGISAFAPENAFEYWRAKQTEAADRTRGLATGALEANKAVADLAVEIMKNAPLDAPITWEQAQMQAAQALGLGSVAGGNQPPPVAYRP